MKIQIYIKVYIIIFNEKLILLNTPIIEVAIAKKHSFILLEHALYFLWYTIYIVIQEDYIENIYGCVLFK
jgi:hypothetical protein